MSMTIEILSLKGETLHKLRALPASQDEIGEGNRISIVDTRGIEFCKRGRVMPLSDGAARFSGKTAWILTSSLADAVRAIAEIDRLCKVELVDDINKNARAEAAAAIENLVLGYIGLVSANLIQEKRKRAQWVVDHSRGKIKRNAKEWLKMACQDFNNLGNYRTKDLWIFGVPKADEVRDAISQVVLSLPQLAEPEAKDFVLDGSAEFTDMGRLYDLGQELPTVIKDRELAHTPEWRKAIREIIAEMQCVAAPKLPQPDPIGAEVQAKLEGKPSAETPPHWGPGHRDDY